MTKPCDTSVYKMSFYGILNPDGEFWSPLIFDSESKAWRHITNFFDASRRIVIGYRVVPVRAIINVAETVNVTGTNDRSTALDPDNADSAGAHDGAK